MKFHGDNSGFYGTFATQNYNSRDYTGIIEALASSSNAVWRINSEVASGQQYETYPVGGSGTYYFGAIIGGGYYSEYKTDRTVVIGGRSDVNSEYVHRTRVNRPSAYVRKVGSGLLTFSGYPYTLTLEGGTTIVMPATAINTALTFAEEGATLKLEQVDSASYDPSAVIKNSTSAIVFDSNGTDYIWTSALASSNVGGFTKNGTGTLTLSQPPEYTGTTKVEGGVLYIVEGYSPTLAAGTVEMASDKTGYKKYVPAAAAVAHVGNLYYPTFAEAWAAAGNDDNAAWIYLDSELAQNDIVTLDTAWQRVRVANGTYSADGHIAISGSLANVALKTSLGAEMTEYTAYPTVTVTVVPGAGVASGEIAAGYISKDGAVYTIYSGSEVTITWTAAEGYEFAGGQSTATTVISPTGNVTPECPAATEVVVGSVSISAPVVGAYGNDFATVSVTAGVTSTYPAATEITYTLKANGTALTVGGSATYDIVKTTNKYVKDIDFLGAGSIKAIKGIQYDAMMAVDQDGVRYATVAEALDRNKSVKGAIIKLLHGTANTSIAGWRFDEATKSFIKKAMGMVFLAF